PLCPPTRTPLFPYTTLFRSLVAVTRGESVAEILGSGDAAQSFQRFRLKKSPLTYVAAPGSATGRRSTLAVRVDGVLWHEVTSLLDRKSTRLNSSHQIISYAV